MSAFSILLWGFAATVVLTTLMSAAYSLHLTRMSLPFMLGTMFSDDRDHANVIGFPVHMLNGWVFATVYAAAFESTGHASWWFGALIGLVHAGFVLTAGMRLLPAMHPRMATEQQGPTPTRRLEPPGPFALNYGRRTPLMILVAHVIYGAILGAFYPA